MRRRCSHSDPLDTYDHFHTTVLDLAECFCKVDVGWELMHFGGRQFSSSFPILFPAGRRFSFSCPCCCCSLRGEPVVVPFVLFVLLTLPIPQLVTLILDDFLVRGVSADDAVDLELTLIETRYCGVPSAWKLSRVCALHCGPHARRQALSHRVSLEIQASIMFDSALVLPSTSIRHFSFFSPSAAVACFLCRHCSVSTERG
ncbi:uncharacterized protein [Physcomitrium patens]|uniref:uncharacterized protein n=1 Tax=Physcomitrium patens TaxID=3218 RepID=UPI003CCCDFAD